MSTTTPTKSPHLELPSAGQPATRPRRSPSQRFPSTLPDGSSTKTGSVTDLLSPQLDYDNDPQRLPRPQAPPSLAHVSISQQAGRPASRQSVSAFAAPQRFTKDNDAQPEALWAEMQRTLADIELSALNTSSLSQVFGAAHSNALEELRTAQISLAKAWARSEADEIRGDKSKNDASAAEGGFSSARSSFEDATVRRADALTSSPSKAKASQTLGSTIKTEHRRRASSSASLDAPDLEAETERDIQLARKRRQANDRYFEQVNRGVLDVVDKLNEVAVAMKKVENESREIWDERSIASNNTNLDPTDGRKTRPRADTQGTTDSENDEGASLKQEMTTTTMTGTNSDVLSDSPVTPKQAKSRWRLR